MKLENQYWHDHDFIAELLKQIPSYVFWKNKESRYIGCNDVFAKSLGFERPEEIIGKTDYDLPTSIEESNAYRADDLQVMETGIPKLNIEETQTLKDGEQRYLLTNKVPLYNNNEVIGILGIYTDITELKKTQQALLKSKEKAEAANQLKTEFIQNMQHDIRTPVSGLISGLEILQENIDKFQELPDNKHYEHVKDIANLTEKAAKQIQLFLNDVIDFENIDYLTRPIQKKQVELKQLIDGIINAEFLAAKTKGIALQAHIDNDVPEMVYGDEYRLRRILLNLIGNAVKFTNDGRVDLMVKIQKQELDKVHIKFTIADTGVGIPYDKLNTIFEKYTRVTPTNQNQYQGLGLGLYRVKSFIESLDGQIAVESEVNHGTRFYVTLPLMTSGSCAEKNATYQTHSTEQARLKSTAEVLLIEDDELASKVANVRLSSNGCNVSIVRNLRDAMVLLQQKRFDFVVSDIGLPDGTGIDIITHVKNDSSHPNYKSPFFALTAHSDADKAQQILDSGFVLCITKPLCADKLDKIFRCYTKLTATNIDDLPVIDWDELNAQYAEEETLINEILQSFIEELPSEKQQLLDAYANNDHKAMGDILHKIKGGIAYCPTPRLEFALKLVQKAIKTSASEDEIKRQFELLIKEIDLVCTQN